MKKILVLVFCACFVCFISVAHSLIAVSSGSVVKANMKLSVVNGTAFVDFSSAGALTPYIGYKIVLTDTGGNTLTGYIKAAGTGETLDNELLGNVTFETTDAITASGTVSIASVAGGQTGNCLELTTATAYTGNITPNPATTTVSGAYYYFSFYTKKGTATALTVQMNKNFAPWDAVQQLTNIADVNWTGITWGFTSQGISHKYTILSAAGTTLLDTFSFKKLLTPSATGVTIVSESGGSTYNWAAEDVGFLRHDTTYNYAIYPGSVSSTIADANTHSYQNIDCASVAGMLGVDVIGAATLQHYTVQNCPAGAFHFTESGTLTNSIGLSSGNDITIAATKTVTGTYNLFGDAARAGTGTYSDGGSTTKWSGVYADRIDTATPIAGLHTSGSYLITGGDACGNTKLYGKGIEKGGCEKKKFLEDDLTGDIIPKIYRAP